MASRLTLLSLGSLFVLPPVSLAGPRSLFPVSCPSWEIRVLLPWACDMDKHHGKLDDLPTNSLSG